MRARRNRVIGGGFAVIIENDDLRVQILFVFDDDHGFLAGSFVHFLLHGDAFDDVVELHLAGFLGQDRDIVRVPLHEGFGLLDLGAVLDGNDRPNHDIVLLQLATVVG